MKTGFLTALMFICGISSAQQMPVVHGTSLSGQSVTLPGQAKGKVAVLVIGFSRASSTPTGIWATQLRTDYGRNPEVLIFRLPFLEEVPRFFRGAAIAGVRKAAGPNEQDTLVTVFEGEKQWKSLVGFSKPEEAYIVVVGPNGGIHGVTHGDIRGGYSGVQKQVNRLLEQHRKPGAR